MFSLQFASFQLGVWELIVRHHVHRCRLWMDFGHAQCSVFNTASTLRSFQQISNSHGNPCGIKHILLKWEIEKQHEFEMQL